VWRERVVQGAAAGAVAAAAVGGVATGLGVRGGAAATAFAEVGRRALGIAATAPRLAQTTAVVAGVLLHLALVVALSIVFALVAGRLRGARLWLAALAYAALVYVTRGALPALLRVGHDPAALPQQLLLHLALAVGLAAGIRLAPLPR